MGWPPTRRPARDSRGSVLKTEYRTVLRGASKKNVLFHGCSPRSCFQVLLFIYVVRPETLSAFAAKARLFHFFHFLFNSAAPSAWMFSARIEQELLVVIHGRALRACRVL